MRIQELIALLQQIEHQQGDVDVGRELAALIHSLQRISEWDLAELVGAIHKLRPKVEPRRIKLASGAVDEAIARIRRLDLEVRNWPSPDYQQVLRIVSDACRELSKAELAAVVKSIVGKAHAKQSKTELLEMLARPAIRHLEIRFMNDGA